MGDLLAQWGFARLDTDQVARQVVQPGSVALKAVIETFGPGVVNSDGTLDRAALARIVFTDQGQRRRLEAILHPLIWTKVREFISDCRKAERNAVIEVPLLFENERQSAFDSVWVVDVDPGTQKARLLARNGWTPEEIESRVASQMPLEEKAGLADVVLDNRGTLLDLQHQVQQALSRLVEGRTIEEAS